MEGGKIQVAESGNIRKIISEEDLRQAIGDIKNFFKENHNDFYNKSNYGEAPK